MEISSAAKLFASLARDTRLLVLRLLIEAGPEGLPAGAISDQLQMAHNSMSFHLGQLKACGLIHSKKWGRSIIYQANFEQIAALGRFLLEDCCSSPGSGDNNLCHGDYLLQAPSPADKPHLKFNWRKTP